MDKNDFNNENNQDITLSDSEKEDPVQTQDAENNDTVTEYKRELGETKKIDIIRSDIGLEKTIQYAVPEQQKFEQDEDKVHDEINVTHNDSADFVEADQPMPETSKKSKKHDDIDVLPEISAVKPQSDEFVEDEQPVPKKTRLEKKLEKDQLKAQKDLKKQEKAQEKALKKLAQENIKQEKIKNKHKLKQTKLKNEKTDPKNEKSVIKMTDIRAARQKEKKKKRLKKLVIVLIIAALAAAAVLTKDLWVGKLEGILDKPHKTIVNDGKTDGKNFPVSRESTSVNFIGSVENYPVIADDAHVYVYNEDGTVKNTFVHNLRSPIVKVTDKRMLVFDNGGKTFKVYSRNDEIYSKTVEENILYAVLGDNGYVAIVTQTEKYPACLTVYDKNGSEIYRWSSGQRIMDISFDNSGDGCYISTFTAVNGQLQSVIHHIKFNSSDEKMTSKALDSLVVDTLENNNGDIWAVGTEKFYKLDKNGEILLEYEYTDDLVSYYLNEYSAAVVVNGTQKNSASVVIFDSDSEKDEPATATVLHGSPKRLAASGRKVLLLNENSVDAFDLKGNCLATAEVSNEYIDFTYIHNSVYLLGYREINKIAFDT